MKERQDLIEAFEQEIGMPLPSEYREYLLLGPVPIWEGEETPENPATHLLHSFHDLGRGENYGDLSQCWKERNELPDWFLEISEVYDGVKIGIGLSAEHRGRIYSYSWDDGEAKQEANSFSEYLERLHADEERFRHMDF